MFLRASLSLLLVAVAAAPSPAPDPLGAALASVRTDTTLGAPYPVPADGVFYVVIVAVTGTARFAARVTDETGRRYHRAHDVEALLPAAPPDVQRYVFDVSDAAGQPVLELATDGFPRRTLRLPLR